MSAVLNRMKGRESYRPVAPICRAEDSARIFDPGGADPYMVFDHRVRPAWLDRIPAVVHADGTARLGNCAKRVLRVIDHSAIYLLIAGTYTPFTLVSLRGPWGWTLFGLVWGLAILGIALKVAATISASCGLR